MCLSVVFLVYTTNSPLEEQKRLVAQIKTLAMYRKLCYYSTRIFETLFDNSFLERLFILTLSQTNRINNVNATSYMSGGRFIVGRSSNISYPGRKE